MRRSPLFGKVGRRAITCCGLMWWPESINKLTLLLKVPVVICCHSRRLYKHFLRELTRLVWLKCPPVLKGFFPREVRVLLGHSLSGNSKVNFQTNECDNLIAILDGKWKLSKPCLPADATVWCISFLLSFDESISLTDKSASWNFLFFGTRSLKTVKLVS